MTCSSTGGSYEVDVSRGNATVGSGPVTAGYAPVTIDDSYPATSSAQVVTYSIQASVSGLGPTGPDSTFSITTTPLADCVAVTAPVTGGCPKGETWDNAKNECVVTCSTPACVCRAAGGEWDGKTCE